MTDARTDTRTDARTDTETRTDTRTGPAWQGRLRAALHPEDPEAGMTTAEYAIGTVAAVAFGGVLFKVITSPQILGLMQGVVSKALQVTF